MDSSLGGQRDLSGASSSTSTRVLVRGFRLRPCRACPMPHPYPPRNMNFVPSGSLMKTSATLSTACSNSLSISPSSRQRRDERPPHLQRAEVAAVPGHFLRPLPYHDAVSRVPLTPTRLPPCALGEFAAGGAATGSPAFFNSFRSPCHGRPGLPAARSAFSVSLHPVMRRLPLRGYGPPAEARPGGRQERRGDLTTVVQLPDRPLYAVERRGAAEQRVRRRRARVSSRA